MQSIAQGHTDSQRRIWHLVPQNQVLKTLTASKASFPGEVTHREISLMCPGNVLLTSTEGNKVIIEK